MIMKKQIILTAVIAILVGSAAMAEVSVTIYNSNLGVVKDTRQLEFEKGTGKISFTDVPSQIDATSVGFKIADPGKNAVILEQNYSYDLVNANKIYTKYLDKEINLFDKQGNLFSGTLLSFTGTQVILRDHDGKIQIVRVGEIVNSDFPELPEGLITRPTLFWLYSADFSGKADCDVTYQTSGIDWSAEYVGILSEDEKNLQLSGWASINNNCGAAFTDATLKLVAGDINRAPAAPPMAKGRMYDMELMASADASGFQEKKFFEYHLYTLPRKTTLANSEIKQISLFDPARTGIEKEYIYEPDQNPKDIKVKLKFTNSEKNGMGMPLPAGRTRIFKADSDGSMILLGEDRIDHTPRNEEVKLTIGNAFDIVGEIKTANVTRISNRVSEAEYEIELRNHKDEKVTVKTIKRLNGNWTILNSNFKFDKKDAYTVEFSLPIDADGKTTLSFTVRTES